MSGWGSASWGELPWNTSLHQVSGAIAAGTAQVNGAGVAQRFAAGDLSVGDAQMDGAGVAQRFASGALQMQPITMSGAAIGKRTAVGDLVVPGVADFRYWVSVIDGQQVMWTPVDDTQP